MAHWSQAESSNGSGRSAAACFLLPQREVDVLPVLAEIRASVAALNAARAGARVYPHWVQAEDQAPSPATRRAEPDVRPLGFIAVCFALLSLVLAPSYFMSLLAYLPAVPAVILGFIARGDEPTRAMGNAALIIAGAAIVAQPALFSFGTSAPTARRHESRHLLMVAAHAICGRSGRAQPPTTRQIRTPQRTLSAA